MANHHNSSYHPEISFSTDFLFDSAHDGEPSMLSQLGISHDDWDTDSAVQNNNFNLISYPDSCSTASPPSLAASAEGPGSSSPPFPLSDNLELGVVHLASPQPRAQKLLKDTSRPRIDLAPDQPTTTQGHPRTRVFVACRQWYALSPH